MKKYIITLSILSIFILTSCNKKTPTNDESSNSDTTTEVDDSDQGKEKEDENKDEDKTDDSVYDDGIDWGPLH